MSAKQSNLWDASIDPWVKFWIIYRTAHRRVILPGDFLTNPFFIIRGGSSSIACLSCEAFKSANSFVLFSRMSLILTSAAATSLLYPSLSGSMMRIFGVRRCFDRCFRKAGFEEYSFPQYYFGIIKSFLNPSWR